MTADAAPVIFLAFANEREDGLRYLRNLPGEARALQTALHTARRAGLCELVVRQGANTDDILSVFQNDEYRNRIAIFHYAGHANGYQLLLDGGERLQGEAFATFLGQQLALQLVFLNGCATEGHVRHLLNAGIASVIATSRHIDDAVATNFASRFYGALSSGASVKSAFAEAEGAVLSTRGNALRALYWGGEETSPDRCPWVLYVRDGAESVGDWSLPAAARAPLFGLPALPELDLPAEPFRHLHWFAREHAWVFFGRGNEIRELYEKVTARSAAPIVLLYGQSGVGKSSLLDAGLRPRLEATHAVRYAKRDPAHGLLGTLRSLLKTKSALQKAWQTLEFDEGRPLVVVLDQVEEAFTAAPPLQTDEVTAFFAALRELFSLPSARPQGKLILGFRKEWLTDVEQRLEERQLPLAKVPLKRLDRDGIIEAVEGPARSERLVQQYGLTVQPELAGLIADDLLGDPSAPIAPTLQILLTRMWAGAVHKDAAHPVFNKSLYRTLKREGLLLGDFLDRELAALRDWQPEFVNSGFALDVLAQHTTSRGTSTQCTTDKLTGTYSHRATELPALVQHYRDRYLLVEPASTGRKAEPATRLAHDTLAPLVRERFEASDLPGQRARRILENRARDWADDKTGPVLDNADLAMVEQGAAGMRAWTEDEERLEAASRDEAERLRAEAERQRKLRRCWRAAGGLVLLLIVGLIINTTLQQLDRLRINRENLSLSLLKDALEMAQDFPQRAVLLLVEALRLPLEKDKVWIAEVETSLRELLARLGGVPLAIPKPNNPWELSSDLLENWYFDPEGRWLVATADRRLGAMWKIMGDRPELVRSWSQEDAECGLAVDPNARWVVAFSKDATPSAWNLAQVDAGPRRLQKPGSCPTRLLVEGEGRWLVAEHATRWLIWDSTAFTAMPVQVPKDHSAGKYLGIIADKEPSLIFRAENNTLYIQGLANRRVDPLALPGHLTESNPHFDLQGHWLAGMDMDDTLRVWDLTNPTADPVIPYDSDSISGSIIGIDIDQGGHWLVTRTKDDALIVWSLKNLASKPVKLNGSGTYVFNQVDFLPGGHWLATSGRQGKSVQFLLWELTTIAKQPVELDWPSEGHFYAFDPQGHWLATCCVNGTVPIWDLSNPAPAPKLLSGPGNITEGMSLTFGPNGRWLAATQMGKNFAHLWNLGEIEVEAKILRGHDDPLSVLSFDPGGRWIVTATHTNESRLWNLDSLGATEPRLLSGLQDEVAQVTFDPTGKWLAAVDRVGRARLWAPADTAVQPVELLSNTGKRLKTLAFDHFGHWLFATTSEGGQLWWNLDDFDGSPVEFDKLPNEIVRDFQLEHGCGRGHFREQPMGPISEWLDNILKRLREQNRLDWGDLLDLDETDILYQYPGWLVVVPKDGDIRMWEMSKLGLNSEPLLLHGQEGEVVTIAVHAEPPWFATLSHAMVRLWDLRSPAAYPVALEGIPPGLCSISFDPEGRWLQGTNGKDSWLLWRLEHSDRRPVAGIQVDQETEVKQLHGWKVTSEDRVVRLWRLTDPPLGPLRLPGQVLNDRAVALDPLERWVATGSKNGDVRMWTLNVMDLIRAACKVVDRKLDSWEWKDHAPRTALPNPCRLTPEVSR